MSRRDKIDKIRDLIEEDMDVSYVSSSLAERVYEIATEEDYESEGRTGRFEGLEASVSYLRSRVEDLEKEVKKLRKDLG